MASLKAVYQNFLANPNGAALNDNASLSYITTLTTINVAAAVVKHFAAHEKVLKKKEEKALDAIESDSALYLEIETTLEFISSGGVSSVLMLGSIFSVICAMSFLLPHRGRHALHFLSCLSKIALT